MNFRETVFLVALAATNLVGGSVFAVFLAIGFARLTEKKNRFLRHLAMLLGLYFLECVAFTWGMCTQVFTIALSFIWAVLFGLWLKGLAPSGKIVRQMLFVSLYGCLPTISFAILLAIIWAIGGNDLLNTQQAANFGIPDFVPWPINTMLGFCIALATGTIILKTTVTTGIIALIARDK
jgi:hypothetical protein